MNHYMKYLYVLISLLTCAASQTVAEDLLDIYQSALEYDPVMRGAEAFYLARLEVKPQARSAVLPWLTFSAGSSSQY